MGTFIVGGIVSGCVVLAIRSLIKNKRHGTGCCGDCGRCSRRHESGADGKQTLPPCRTAGLRKP